MKWAESAGTRTMTGFDVARSLRAMSVARPESGIAMQMSH